MDVQALSSSTGVNGSEQRGSLRRHGHSWVRRGSSVHQHGVVGVVVVVGVVMRVVGVGVVGQVGVERGVRVGTGRGGRSSDEGW